MNVDFLGPSRHTQPTTDYNLRLRRVTISEHQTTSVCRRLEFAMLNTPKNAPSTTSKILGPSLFKTLFSSEDLARCNSYIVLSIDINTN